MATLGAVNTHVAKKRLSKTLTKTQNPLKIKGFFKQNIILRKIKCLM